MKLNPNKPFNHALLDPLSGLEGFINAQNMLDMNESSVWVDGLSDAQKWHFAAGLLYETEKPTLIVAPSELKAKEIYENLYFFFRETLRIYPSRDLLFYAADVKSPDITRRRLVVLDRLIRHKESGIRSPIVILSGEALLDRMTPADRFYKYRMTLENLEMYVYEDIIKRLVQMGYERSAIIEGPGQYAVKGGILDIYPIIGSYNSLSAGENVPFAEGNAVRIEFFGDEIDSMRLMDTHSQRSIENIQAIEIYPVRELVFSSSRLKNTISKIKSSCEEQVSALENKGLKKEAAALKSTIKNLMSDWSDGYVSNADSFLPFFYDEKINLLD